MNIIALDCATKTGWATLIGGNIESGTQDFSLKRGESQGIMFMRFNKWLQDMHDTLPHNMNEHRRGSFDIVAYEQAHNRGGAATEICIGLTTRAQEFAARYSAETMAVHSQSLKKFVTGSGRADKAAMIAAFEKETGQKPIDDNQADAYWILRYVMQEVGE